MPTTAAKTTHKAKNLDIVLGRCSEESYYYNTTERVAQFRFAKSVVRRFLSYIKLRF